MAARSSDVPYTGSVKDVAAHITSLRLNGAVIKRQAVREQHTMPLTYSRLRATYDHQQQKPRRVQASSHLPPHGKGRSTRSTRHSTKVLKKASWVGESDKRSVESVARAKEQSQETISRASYSESSSGCDSPSVRVDTPDAFRFERIPKRLNGVGKDRETCASVVRCSPTDKSQSFDGTELTRDFDTLTLYESANPLLKVTAKLRNEILRSEDDESVDSWGSSLERQPGDGCTGETSTIWSDEDVLSNLSADEDGGDLEATSLIHLDDDFCGPPILPEIPLCSPLKRKQFLASCSPNKVASSPGNSRISNCESGTVLTSCKQKLVEYRLPKRSKSLTFPTDSAHTKVSVKSDEALLAKATKEPANPLATSLFPNVPPSIYFPLMDEQCTCVCLCVHVCVRVCVYVCVCVCVYTYVCMHACVHVCVHVCVYMHVYMCVLCVCVCVR